MVIYGLYVVNNTIRRNDTELDNMPEVVCEKIIKIADGIHRITAANPSVMTGAGTNTYLLGTKHIAVIDPGPALDGHISAIVNGAKELGGSIDYIIVTHTHMDHSPAAAPLQALTGAKMIGKSPADHQFQDETFKPDVELSDGYVLKTDEFSLRAIHTPGHVGNHYCLLEENAEILFTGDHIMNGSTVVVVPPSGNMADYISSLEKLLAFPLQQLGPAHGDVMAEPKTVISGIVKHRLAREDKVFTTLIKTGPIGIDDLVPLVYDDVHEDMHGVAYYSLWAHLEKLNAELRIGLNNKQWSVSA